MSRDFNIIAKTVKLLRGNVDENPCDFFLNDFYFFHYSGFTVFCQFLLYSQVTQSCNIYGMYYIPYISHYPYGRIFKAL